MPCEECGGILSGPDDDECKNPECGLYVPSPESPNAVPKVVCSCGEMYEGRPCAPDCESWGDH